MHRAAVRVFRTTYQTTIRGLARTRTTNHLTAARAAARGGGGTTRAASAAAAATRSFRTSTSSHSSSRAKHVAASVVPLASTMYIRRFSVALVSSLVGYGAWYAYNGTEGSYKLRADAPDAVPTRTVLVIGADELHTSTLVGDGPVTKDTSGGRKVIEMLTPEQVDDKLRQMEQSYLVNRGEGVVRYDLVQLPSNNPIEDDHAESIVQVPGKGAGNGDNSDNSDWMFWGVFDGHSGWSTSAKLRQSLIHFVARELNDTYKTAGGSTPADEAIDAAIKTGFTRLDDEIVHKSVEKVFKQNSRTLAAEILSPALAGSCALLTFYDSRSKLLRVACTGDSRAVLGRRTDSGKWTATALSDDQTGSNPDEVARMQKLHPGEPNVISRGRVLGGLEPTRAFGDATYKWSRDVADRLKKQFFGKAQSSFLKTPPYVTAEPVVTTTRVNPERGDFLVLATDGLWEMLSNDEVVGLVGKWIEKQQRAKSGMSQFDSLWDRIFGAQAGLPVERSKSPNGPDGAKSPFRLEQWGMDATEDRFIVEDKNVATHLVRNALGGKKQDQVSALLTLPAPFSRRYRDDLTVQVIFFGDGAKTGEVTLNLEASYASKDVPKAKL